MTPLKNWQNLIRGFRFGEIYPSNWGDLSGKPHLGLDLICPVGTELYAPLAGEIIMTGETAVSGKFIHLKCDDLIFRFLHLSEIIKTGKVSEGELIGLTGNTGSSTGSHLHWDISRNVVDIFNFSNFIDPENWAETNKSTHFDPQTMQKIKIQESINVDVGIKYKVIDFFLKNGYEIEFGTFADYFAFLVQGMLNTNPYARKANGGCYEAETPYKITFAADPDDIEYSAMILEHEILHGLFKSNGLRNIHDIEWELKRLGVVDWDMGQLHNQNAIDYLNKNKITSDNKETMKYITNDKNNQFILVPEIKVAYTIANPTDLGKLKVQGLVGEPIRQEVPSDYLIFAAADQQEIRELFNL
ncbi:MAG: M23 family metallopeptidase [Patescibacteria group bacterium]